MVKLSSIVNIANSAKTDEQRNAVGVELKKLLKGARGCDPKSQMYAPRMNSITSIQRGRLFSVASGQSGAVYYGCLDDKCKTKVAIKFTSEPSANMEYRIAEKLKGMGVPRMYHFKSCDNRDILYFEYIDGVPLEKWMRNNPGIDQYKSVIRQVISNLYKIHQKYPDFRHHDLHWNNIMITKTQDGKLKPVIIDFGLAVMKGIKNPVVNNGGYLTSGISRKSHPMYDAHYFLNIIRTYTHSKVVKEFVRNLFKNPNMYMVRNNPHVSTLRLKLVKHEGLPTFEEILNDPFLTGKRENVTKKILNAVAKSKKNFVPRVVLTKPMIVPTPRVVPGETALDRAKRIFAEGVQKKRAPIRRPIVREIEKKVTPPPPTPPPPMYTFINVKGKKRIYKTQGWYEKALYKNRVARNGNNITLADLMKKLKA
jgi:predicted Ser/Thr protein kinase